MELLHFALRYVWTVVWGWGGLALGLLGIVELLAWISGQPLKALRGWLGKYRWRIAIVLIMFAQADAYRELERQGPQVPTQQIPSGQSFGGSLDKFNNEIGKNDWAVPWA